MSKKRELSAAFSAAFFFIVFTSSHALPQEQSLLHSIELCNGSERNVAGSQIEGCTTLITSRATTSLGLAIAYNNRGNAYTAIEKYDLAISDYNRALALNPNFVRALNNRGVAYEKRADYDRALEDFDAAVELDDKYAYAYVNRGDIYSKKGDYQHAADDYGKAIELNEKLASAWSGRCLTRAQTGHIQDALEDCNQSIQLDANATGFDARGFARLKLAQWDAAISDYDSALKLNPKLAAC